LPQLPQLPQLHGIPPTSEVHNFLISKIPS
jgi:hypothetical protein